MDIPSIRPIRLLSGHVSADTAYLVEDYPYGRRLRCRIRSWIDTATRGAHNGQQRFVYQTTNPKQPGHPWNTPHASTYSLRTWMYLDEQDHVQHTGLSQYGLDPHRDAWFRLTGIYHQLDGEDRGIYDTLLAASRTYPQPWDRWDDTIGFLVEHLTIHGQPPPVDNGFVQRDEHPFYIGADAYPTAVALAHTRLLTGPQEGHQQ